MLMGYDSTSALDVYHAFPNASVVMGYNGGKWPWTEADYALFPHAYRIDTAVSSRINGGNELDVESGDAAPADVPAWVRMRVLAGLQKVSIYMSASVWPDVKKFVDDAELTDHVVYRVAHWDNVAEGVIGTWAKQYSNPPRSGGHWDLNAVTDVSWIGEGYLPAGAQLPTIPATPPPPVVAPPSPVVSAPVAPVCPGLIYRGLGMLPHGPSGIVHDWQIALTQHGFDTRGVDGRDGKNTTAAVLLCQHMHAGLVVDGIGGPKTWAAMWG